MDVTQLIPEKCSVDLFYRSVYIYKARRPFAAGQSCGTNRHTGEKETQWEEANKGNYSVTSI